MSDHEATQPRTIAASIRLLAWFAIGVATLLCLFATTATFAARWHWLLDLTTHFRAHYAAALLVLGACYLAGLRYRPAAFAILLALVNVWFIAPYYLPVADEGAMPPDTPRLLIVSINLFAHSQAHAEVVDYVRTVKPDIVVLLELTDQWKAALAVLKPEYPESHFLSRSDAFGVGLLSKRPLDEARFDQAAGLPIVRARLPIGDRSLKIFGVHPLPPAGAHNSAARNQALAALNRMVWESTGPIIVAGDLNTTGWSPHFTDLLARTTLRDSRLGQGLQATWPTNVPQPLRITIDHFLVSSEVRVLGRRVGPDIGSDHLPIEMDFAIEPTAER
ncbi:MAG: endonuclease/exonuclease/phosphatase family protein [Planctomycetia bacterium]|nr:endonuclease/exonuclease/phosphatase family protein [Planctomycetia bacterium]